MTAIDLCGKHLLQTYQKKQVFLHVENLKFKKCLKTAQRDYLGISSQNVSLILFMSQYSTRMM